MRQDPKLQQEIREESVNWSQYTIDAAAKEVARKNRPTWNRQGLHWRVKQEVNQFEYKTGIELPYNLSTHGPYVGFPWDANFQKYFQEVAEESFRFCGWLRKAADSRVLTRLIQRTTSYKGVNSPRTVLDLWKLAERYPSPHRAVRQTINIRRRANEILKPYGLKVSWEAVAEALQYGSKKVGKAAKKAAAGTIRQLFDVTGTDLEVLMALRGLSDLGGLEGFKNQPKHLTNWAMDRVKCGEFKTLREAINAAPDRLVFNETDGVELWLDTKSKIALHGVQAVKGWTDYGAQWLLSYGDRTYHAAGSHSLQDAVKSALRAWKLQRSLMREESDMLDILQPEDRTILVFKSDSYAAGNCESGTRSWMEQHGFDNRRFVPVTWLFKHITDWHVRNVLLVVAKRLKEQKLAA